jgi:hypothetical protein
MITKISLMNQICAAVKTCSGALIDLAKPVQALQHLAYKLAPRYNYIPDKLIADIEDFGQLMPASQ